MVILEKSNRIKNIEDRFNALIKDLLYQMHWPENMKHKDMGSILNLPRPTVTKWFHRFRIPTQSCRRFTDKNLTSWFYKTGRLKKKLRYEWPNRRIQRTKASVNVDFFKRWSAEMAYVLGYFAADGCMYINPRGSRYFCFYSTDREILEKVKTMLNAKQNIALRKMANKKWKVLFYLQIGSKEIFDDLMHLGFTANKALRFKLPAIPRKYTNHFVRGYFDGDGSVTYGHFCRKDRNGKRTPYLLTCFASANIAFLKRLSQLLTETACMGKGYLYRKGYHLSYSKFDSTKLFCYMYKGVKKEQYLERKYYKFCRAIKSGA